MLLAVSVQEEGIAVVKIVRIDIEIVEIVVVKIMIVIVMANIIIVETPLHIAPYWPTGSGLALQHRGAPSAVVKWAAKGDEVRRRLLRKR